MFILGSLGADAFTSEKEVDLLYDKIIKETDGMNQSRFTEEFAAHCSPDLDGKITTHLIEKLRLLFTVDNEVIEYWTAMGIFRVGPKAKALLPELVKQREKYVNIIASKSPLSAIDLAIKSIKE